MVDVDNSTVFAEPNTSHSFPPVPAAAPLLGYHVGLLLGESHALSSPYDFRCVCSAAGTIPLFLLGKGLKNTRNQLSSEPQKFRERKHRYVAS